MAHPTATIGRPDPPPVPSSGGVPAATLNSIPGQIQNINADLDRQWQQEQQQIAPLVQQLQRETNWQAPQFPKIDFQSFANAHPRNNVDIMQGLGSPMAIMAIFGSLLTRRPIIAALNAATAAMQGYAQGNQDAYQRAEQSWRDNLDLALKQYETERDAYSAEIQKHGNKVNDILAGIQAVGTPFHDQILVDNAKAGNWGTVAQILESRARTAEAAQNHLDMMKFREDQAAEMKRYHDDLIGERQATREDREKAAATKRTDRQAVINAVTKNIDDAISMIDDDPTVSAGAGYFRSLKEHGQAALSDWGLPVEPPKAKASDFESKIEAIKATAGKLLTNRSTAAIDATMTEMLSGNNLYGGSAVVRQQLTSLKELLQNMSTAPVPGATDAADPYSTMSNEELLRVLNLGNQ